MKNIRILFERVLTKSFKTTNNLYILDPKRTVPIKSLDTIRKKLTQPWGSWRINRLTTYLTDLVRLFICLNIIKISYFRHRMNK